MSQSTNNTVALTIAEQLGGLRRLSMMVGARNFVSSEDSLTFKLGRGAKDGITHVTVTLDADDTYTVRFCRCWGTKVTEKGTSSGIYNDMLVALFESSTGFYLTF